MEFVDSEEMLNAKCSSCCSFYYALSISDSCLLSLLFPPLFFFCHFFNGQTMSKMQRHQQEALWEFVHTELTYINKLIIIKDLVIAALVNLHQHGFLQEVTPELLFSNLPSILSAHQLFWQEVIYPMLHDVRRTGKPFDPMRLEAGCLQVGTHCLQDKLQFTRRQMESNPHFLTYVQWVETHPQCERMRLGDMQAKPHQRITKYSLLLQAVLKNTPDSQVQQILRGMLSSVNSFLESINDYLRLKDEELALSISAQRVEGYEVEGINEEIDKHVREICQFDLTCPIRGVGPEVVRRLLLEENLKIRDRKDSKLEVVALLFSDVLLMTKVPKKGERLRVVRPPLALDKTSCIALKDGCE
uniref:DH domain-containing protein n=1 Tax=Lates calcarifer TaxID=8187 RepID=A0A4W6DFZ0_LATCA